jgi:hypothetical protein
MAGHSRPKHGVAALAYAPDDPKPLIYFGLKDAAARDNGRA